MDPARAIMLLIVWNMNQATLNMLAQTKNRIIDRFQDHFFDTKWKAKTTEPRHFAICNDTTDPG